jgi:hypothetical protein
MATSPAAFFRFLSENVDLVMALFERGRVDEAGLLALIDRHRSDGQAAAEHIRRQIQDVRVVERAPDADAEFELAPQVADLLAWLTHRQRLSSATVLLAYLEELGKIGRDLEGAIRTGDASLAALALKEADGLVDRVRALSEGNRESIITEAQQLRAAGADVSAVERFQIVSRLWDRYLQPLRQLVAVQGEMDQRLSQLRILLVEGERRFAAHGGLQRPFGRMEAALARMRRVAFEDHHAAMVEIAPLYDRLRRDSRWLIGASRALKLMRDDGPGVLGLDRRMGLTGWRTRHLMSDDKLRARLAELVGYEPGESVVLAAPPPPPELTIITRDDLRRALVAAIPVPDVLAFVLAEWPGRPMGAYLRAFGHICGGAFGQVEVGTSDGARVYGLRGAEIVAWPLSLRESS